MSNDFDVAKKLKPDQSVLDEFVRWHKDLKVEGHLGVAEANVVLNRLTSNGVQVSAEIYGPFVAEDDDISEKLAIVVPAPRWLLQIVVPAGTQEDVGIALSLAEHIARRCDGAVFDPQSDDVLGQATEPRLQTRPFSDKRKAAVVDRVSIAPERIPGITLEWFLPMSSADPRTAKVFLDTLRRVCPEAVPTRFGTFEPFQGRLAQG